MSAFTAKYPGTCAGCRGHIDPGEQVVHVDDELVHLECETAAMITVDETVPVCPNCYMVKPCPCEDGQ